MTNKFDYQIEILQAAKEGKPLQSRLRNSSKQEWTDGVTNSKEGVLFDFTNYEFRVKKEPEVLYRVESLDPSRTTWSHWNSAFSEEQAKSEAEEARRLHYHTRIRKFVEVLEGED